MHLSQLRYRPQRHGLTRLSRQGLPLALAMLLAACGGGGDTASTPSTAQRLLAQGRPADTPVVVIENCSRADQRIVRLPLSALAHGLGDAHGPVLVMLGQAMAARAHQAIDKTAAILARHA